MSSFGPLTSQIDTVPPDPFKHVLFNNGMVIGADDFTQEFAYLAGHDHWHNRDLHGYGTVCGLSVRVTVGADGPQVEVSAGTAINPRGQMIRVPEAQCARLNAWLEAHEEELLQHVGSPPGGVVSLYVVLCYRECPLDLVPIPGEP